GHLSHIETRPDQAFLLVRESDEDVSMFARLNLYRVVKGRQQRSAAPVVDDSVTFGYAIEVRSDDDDLVRTARQQANDIGQLRSLHRLFGNVLPVTTGFSEHLL